MLRPTLRTSRRLSWSLPVAALALAALGCKGPPAPPRVLPADPAADARMPGAALGDLDRGAAFVQNKAYAEAIPYFDRALEADPKNAQALYYRGLCRDELGDRPAAERDYKAALGVDAGLVEAAINLGALYLADPPRPEQAIAVLAPAAAKNPGEADLASNLAAAYELVKDYDKAAAAYRQALKAAGGADAATTGALELRFGQMLIGAGHGPDAVEHLQKALAAYTDDVAAVVTIAHLFGQAKAPKECIKAFDRAIALKSDNPEWYVQRGVCRHDAGTEPEAREDFEAAIKLDPKNAGAYYALGKSYYLDRKRLNASQALQKAVSFGGDGPFAKGAQKLLDRMIEEDKYRK